MGTLLSSFQRIVGAKEFLHKVTFKGPVRFEGKIERTTDAAMNLSHRNDIDVGTLKIIPEVNRSSVWQLNGSVTRGVWTDMLTGPNPYTPKGVKAVRLKWALAWTGDTALNYGYALLRQNGSAAISGLQTHELVVRQNDAPAEEVSFYGEVDVLCDTDGLVEYYLYATNGTTRADGTLYLTTIGYWL